MFYAVITNCKACIDRYTHPSLIYCNDRKRIHEYFILNQNTSEQNFNDVFLQSNVDYLAELTEYEEFRDVGGIAFWVVEP